MLTRRPGTQGDGAKTIRSLDDLIPDDRNPNAGTERGMGAVEKSLEQYGAGRSILVDAKGKVIAGNKTLQAAADKGFGVDVVQTTGDRLVVVQRTDLDLDDPKGPARALSVADNRAGELGLEWDMDEMAKLVEDGMDVSAFFSEGEMAELLKGIGENERERSAPEQFKEVGEDIETNRECPRCHFKWSDTE